MKKLTIQQAIEKGYTHFHFSHKNSQEMMPIGDAHKYIEDEDVELILLHINETKSGHIHHEDWVEFFNKIIMNTTCNSEHCDLLHEEIDGELDDEINDFNDKFNKIVNQVKYYESTNIILVL